MGRAGEHGRASATASRARESGRCGLEHGARSGVLHGTERGTFPRGESPRREREEKGWGGEREVWGWRGRVRKGD